MLQAHPIFLLVPSSAKVNSSVNRANIPGSTLRRGQKKKHKSLLASVVSAAAASANFHTLNIYFHSLCVCRFSVVVYSPQSLLSASYFLLLQKIKDFWCLVCYDNGWGVNFKLCSPSGMMTFLQGGTVAKCCPCLKLNELKRTATNKRTCKSTHRTRCQARLLQQLCSLDRRSHSRDM